MFQRPASRLVLAWALLVLAAVEAEAQSSLGKPRVALIVDASDSASQRQAARFFRIAREKLRRSRTVVLVDTDQILGGRREGRAAAKRARALYEEGRKAYEMLELQESVGLLQHAARELESRLGEMEDCRLYSDLHTYLGAALVLLGNRPEGREVFRKLLVFNRQAEINPLVFPPELTAVFEETAAEVRRSGTGELEVQALPGGTEVWLNGTYQGISPVLLDRLVEGEHILRLTRRGYRSQGWKQDVRSGSTELIRQRLEPLPGLERQMKRVRHVLDRAGSDSYPDGVDSLTRRMKIDRLMVIGVAIEGDYIAARAFYYDRNFRTCLKALEKRFNQDDPGLEDQLGLFVTSVHMQVREPAPRVGDIVTPPRRPPEETVETGGAGETTNNNEDTSSIFTSWWFWTATGVLVAGGVGLVLALTMGGSQQPPDAEVIFRF